jgi:hypothetical protein
MTHDRVLRTIASTMYTMYNDVHTVVLCAVVCSVWRGSEGKA